MIGGLNFEPWINGGYRRIKGFERFDGRPKPSDAQWVALTLDIPFVGTLGDTVTGDTSGATGVVIAQNDTVPAIYVTDVVGTFVDTEGLDTATYTVSGFPNPNFTQTASDQQAVRFNAEDYYRQQIQQVPGLNPIRGIWQIRDRVYAFRDNVGETACEIHKATATGWSQVGIEMAHTLRYDAGTVSPLLEGEAVTGLSSGATGTIQRSITFGGSTGSSDAFGYLSLTSVSGTFTDGEAIQVSAVTRATADGGSSQFTLPVGGRYSFISENFYANSATYRVYAANGVGPGFEIDENDIVTPILLDLSAGDAPSENVPFLVAAFNGRLWLAFPGGSVQHSIVGDPLVWNGFLGAAEYGLGEEVTSLEVIRGDVLSASTRRQWHAFYPNNDAGSTYTKKIISDRAGAILYGVQRLDTVYAADDSGIVDLRRVEQFGDFAAATVSDLIQPDLDAAKERITGSLGVRESNQYRLLYENGAGIIGRMRPDGVAEWGRLDYGTPVSCSYSCENAAGTPSYYFGGDSGYVYEAERGRSFDGGAIQAFMRLPFNHQGRPATRKRYRLAELEIEADLEVSLLVAQENSYANEEVGSYSWNDLLAAWEDQVSGGGGFYDIDNWDEIYWDSQTVNSARFELRGTGKNVSLLFYNESAITEPFIMQGVVLHFDERRVQR